MATNSIYKNISIRNKNAARNLVNALEHAHNKQSKEVVLSKKRQEIGREKIKEFFGVK